MSEKLFDFVKYLLPLCLIFFFVLRVIFLGVAPPGTRMLTIISAAVPFLVCDLLVMIILITFPKIVMLLPSLM